MRGLALLEITPVQMLADATQLSGGYDRSVKIAIGTMRACINGFTYLRCQKQP